MSKADMEKAKSNLRTNIFIEPTKTREYKRSRKVILKYNLKGARAVRSQLAEISIYVGAVYWKVGSKSKFGSDISKAREKN